MNKKVVISLLACLIVLATVLVPGCRAPCGEAITGKLISIDYHPGGFYKARIVECTFEDGTILIMRYKEYERFGPMQTGKIYRIMQEDYGNSGTIICGIEKVR